MKRYLFGAVITMLSLWHLPAAPAETELILSGTIISKTCDIAVDSVDQTVSMGTWSVLIHDAPGTVSPRVPFNLLFSRCGKSVQEVQIAFKGRADPLHFGYLKLDEGATSNVNLILTDSNNKMQPINPSDGGYLFSLQPGQDNVLTFYGRYIAAMTPVVPGSADATVTFDITWP